MTTIRDLIPNYLAALADETRATAKTKAIRAVIDRLAREENARSGGDRWKSPGYGDSTVRLDGTTATPTVTIGRDTEFADWLAQREPGLVTATITVPADKLADAITALEFADIDVTASAVTTASGASAWVADNCRPSPDTDDPAGLSWLVQQVQEDDDKVTVVTASVPGLVAVKKQPRLVVTLDRKIRAQIEADAVEAADTELAALDAPAPAPEPVTELVPLVWTPDGLARYAMQHGGYTTPGIEAARAVKDIATMTLSESTSPTTDEATALVQYVVEHADDQDVAKELRTYPDGLLDGLKTAFRIDGGDAPAEKTPAAVVALDRRRTKRGA